MCLAPLTVTLALAWLSSAAAQATSVLSLEVLGLRDDHGVVRAAVFDDPSSFPSAGREVASCETVIVGARAVCRFEDLPPGVYAVAFFHDRDDDGEFDRDWIGLPSEGFGFSNDAAPGLGPPPFERARLVVSGPTHHTATVRYGL